MLRVIINGANGRMGRVSQAVLAQADDITVIAGLTRENNLAAELQAHRPDVVIDFTVPDVIFENTQIILDAGARPIIGTTGFTNEQIAELQEACHKQQRGGLIVPNFSIAALLMMRYAQKIAAYFPAIEIIEMHHDKKLDAPSGTAQKTAALIEEVTEKTPPIHSVRLPGYFSHQKVLFGGNHETLSLSYDALDRQAIAPGLLIACRKVMQLNKLVYGLDTLID